jgi:hypothetical protein
VLPPKKFVTFSERDSRSIEAAYQHLADEYDDPSKELRSRGEDDAPGRKMNTSINEAGNDENAGGIIRVPVQEDWLFDVDILERELSPVYWLGPIYSVRRGSWFFQEGSTLRPCDENLAAQLEEGYLKVKPFRYPKVPEKPSSRPISIKPGEDPKSLALAGAFGRNRAGSGEVTPRASIENLRAANQQALDDTTNVLKDVPVPQHQPQTHRLFGTYMNSIVTYENASVAWLSADSLMSRVCKSPVSQSFTPPMCRFRSL